MRRRNLERKGKRASGKSGGGTIRARAPAFDSAQIGKILIAYEPVWAIGTGNACSPDDALSMLVLIKKVLQEKFSGSNIPILYGGSTDDKNIASYIEVGYSGALVGGSSLEAFNFFENERGYLT